MTDAPDIRAEILARATRAGLTITTAESCTGGMVA
ncbi:MAG TPA: damage-inducible protein CinA, partial [Roseovarius nubinhibens]|nr:damage-inducible protein CinA [Roseovarius nubinhibens]